MDSLLSNQTMDAYLDEIGVVPVVVIEQSDRAVALAESLVSGGLPIIEVTLRTDAALEAIELMSSRVPEAIVGAGTVLNESQLDAAHGAGAKFAVSPGLNRTLVESAMDRSMPLYPGIQTASELQAAWNMGLRTVKFFPAGLAGGIPMLKALSSVFSDMRFMPTGGITSDNLRDYLSLPSVTACGGSWLSPAELLETKDYAAITQLALNARSIAGAARASE